MDLHIMQLAGGVPSITVFTRLRSVDSIPNYVFEFILSRSIYYFLGTDLLRDKEMIYT